MFRNRCTLGCGILMSMVLMMPLLYADEPTVPTALPLEDPAFTPYVNLKPRG